MLSRFSILVTLSIGLAVLGGCSSAYDVQSSGGASTQASIPSTSSVFVAVPADGRFGKTLYSGSGSMTAQALVTALSSVVKSVRSSNNQVDRVAGMAEAKRAGFTHYAEPIILLWEDRATEWSGKRDRVVIRISVLNTVTGKLVDATTIQGTSKWATLGGDHPQDLLPVPMRRYVAQLVR